MNDKSTDKEVVSKERAKTKRKQMGLDVVTAKAILEIETAGNERHMLRNTIYLLYKRGDFGRLADLRALYFLSYPGSDELNIMKFYYWYRGTPISAEDEIVYSIYVETLREMGITTRVNPALFSERGLTLMGRLLEWCGDCGNPLEEIIAIYFKLVIKRIAKFNKANLAVPKTLLEDYGWKTFNEQVTATGGKGSYLTPSRASQSKDNRQRKKLDVIQEARQKLLDDGHVREYDEIGRMLSEQGIDAAYKELYP